MTRPIVHALLAMLMALATSIPAPAAEPQMAHMVFFKLKQGTDQARSDLVAACHKYLSGHQGVVYYSVGVVARDMDRDVNVLDFDVSLHVVFVNRAAHDRYQTADRHLKFVEENKTSWESVRVFDSYIRPLNGPRDDQGAERAGQSPGRAAHGDRSVTPPTHRSPQQRELATAD